MLHQPGTQLKRSKYRLLGLIGQGQFGQVFCAVHRQTGQLVALKNLEHERFPTHKFLRELRFLLSLQHPNIVTCQALEHTPTGRYLAMDYCEGGTLRNLMTEESHLNLGHSLKLVADILAGLDHAHNRGIVHCDIKPENILLNVHAAGWTARISDFGIARFSQEIIAPENDTGSPAYMAPERFYGQYSIASDLYSVGILLFELIAGYRPFRGTPAELMSAHLNHPLKLPDTIPLVWQQFIARSLQKLPTQRFRSAAEMLNVMQEIASTELAAEWNNWPAKHMPLFTSVVRPPECPFKPLNQHPLSEPIGGLAVALLQPPDPESVPPFPSILYSASTTRLQFYVDRTKTLFGAESTPSQSLVQPAQSPESPAQSVYSLSAGHLIDWSPPISISDEMRQLLVRPQGCFIVMQRSISLLALDVSVADEPALQVIGQLEPGAKVAIDPQGYWLASLSQPSATQLQLSFLQLLDHHRFTPASALILNQPSAPHASLNLLALDSHHLALITTPISLVDQPYLDAEQTPESDVRFGSTIHLLTRRGDQIGSIQVALRLQHMILTPTPYRLLATEADQPGTVLLVDLKPYRLRRLWVEITPAFLAVTDWGYILAESSGRIVVLDLEGRQVGAIDSPFPITAITPVQQYGLLVATWDREQGCLYSLDLRTLGMDLVF